VFYDSFSSIEPSFLGIHWMRFRGYGTLREQPYTYLSLIDENFLLGRRYPCANDGSYIPLGVKFDAVSE
jgi:hypothetical protein